MTKSTLLSKGRIVFILIVFVLLFVALLCRFAYLQLIQGEELSQKALSQQIKNSVISPKRGSIYDRNGVALAKSVSVDTISITPQNIKEKDKERVAKGLSELLDLDYDTLLRKS